MAEKLGYRPREAADYLGLSPRYIQVLIRSGDLEGIKVGRTTVIPQTALEDFLWNRADKVSPGLRAFLTSRGVLRENKTEETFRAKYRAMALAGTHPMFRTVFPPDVAAFMRKNLLEESQGKDADEVLHKLIIESCWARLAKRYRNKQHERWIDLDLLNFDHPKHKNVLGPDGQIALCQLINRGIIAGSDENDRGWFSEIRLLEGALDV